MAIFIKDLTDYKCNVGHVKDWITQVTKLVALTAGIDTAVANDLLITQLKKHDIINPLVEQHYRLDNGDKAIKSVKLTNYIDDAKKRGRIIAPSFTIYENPKIKKSTHKEYVINNKTKRSIEKKSSFVFKQKGDITNFIIKDTLQKAYKLFNNSLSGAYASVSTALYNPSAHYTLTSITRSVASISNMHSESMVSGNRMYRTTKSVLGNILDIITNVDMDKVRRAIDKYGLSFATFDQAMSIIKINSSKYWNSKTDMSNIEDFVKRLNNLELTAFVYVNDLYHLRENNSLVLRTMFERLIEKRYRTTLDPFKVVSEMDPFILNMTHHIVAEDIRGKELQYFKMKGTPTLELIAATSLNIDLVFKDYALLFDAFFKTDVMAVDTAYMKDMIRNDVVLSDTDSTCTSYGEFGKWFFGEFGFSPEQTALTASVMTIVTQTADHNIKLFTANMNVTGDDLKIMNMKNEYYFPVFTVANMSKHYYAGIDIREGFVYEKTDYEIKGAHLIASKLPPKYKSRARGMMEEIITRVTNNEKIDLFSYITEVANIEREILLALDNDEIGVLKSGDVKEKEAYKKGEEDPNYKQYLLWEEVFADKYGHVTLPYTTCVFNVTTDNKSKLLKYIDTIEDLSFRARFKEFARYKLRHDDDKTGGLGTLRIPKQYLLNGYLEELKPIIDKKRMVENVTNVFYIILETLGYYRNPNSLVSDTY